MSNNFDWIISWTLGRMINAGESMELAVKRFALFCLLYALWIVFCLTVIYPVSKYAVSALLANMSALFSAPVSAPVAPASSQLPCTPVGTYVTPDGRYIPMCH